MTIRSGLVLRRTEGQTDSMGDTTTLAEPHVVDEFLQLEEREVRRGS